MADENIVTNIVANADFSDLIANVNKVTTNLAQLKQTLTTTDKALALQAAKIQQNFAATLRSTGQFSTHFVSLSSDVDKFGKNLDSGKLKLRDYYATWQNHSKTAGGLIRDLAKQQVQLQNSILQPLGRNAEGLMQFNVQVPRGLDVTKNKAALLKQEMQIMNKVIQDGGVQLINWGKNTQWAGRQLTVGLTIPIAAFGKAAADAFRVADEQLVRLTKVYGGVAQTSAVELGKIRKEVAATAKDLAQQYGASYTETIALAADIAATGKQGEDLLNSTRETTRLSVLGEVDRQEAMKATLAIQTAFNQNTQQLSESINFLNAVENQTSTSLADLVEAIPKAGPVVKSLGGSIQDLALYLTAMKEGGINASEGANAIKSSLASLINPTKVAKEMFAGFGIDLGGIVTSNAGNLTGTILELQKALDTLDPLTKSKAIEQLFGKFQFARLSALFDNLGKQGSQTLQVLDLMNSSASDLANVAGRELSQITESASGKYRRALEGLKADLAGVGDAFLNIQTFFINLIDKVIEFNNKLPDPIKKILTLVGGLTALAGPAIMLTGVLANFFGYIVKGIAHFKALFKGGEGWKLLTPEILAAQKAGNLMETTFYSDAKAANILGQALANLNLELDELSRKASSGTISARPVISTLAGNNLAGVGREVVPNHPLISERDTRSFSHLNPLSRMTAEEKATQTIFGVVPGAPLVNQKISNNPQMYMSGDLPKVAGASAIRGVSTGIVAEEAAKFHSMTGALAMQSQQEIALLKKEIAATGLITTSLSDSYQALLPEMSRITSLAAAESAQIVAELQASKINVDQARAKIIALNKQIEAMMGQAATGIATAQGRTINLTQLPIVDQPAFDPVTGKANMKELTRPRNRSLINKIAGALGVKTFGAPYSIETTRPKRFATGNLVPGNGNADTVPALLTPGEFVVNKKATSENLPLLTAINGGAGSRSGSFRNGGGYLEDNVEPFGAKTSGLTSEEVGKAFPGFSGKSNFYTVKGTAGLYIGDVTDPKIIEKYKNFLPKGKTYFTAKSLNGKMATGKIPSELLAAAIESSGSANRGSTEQFLRSLYSEGLITEAEFKNTSNKIYNGYIQNLKKPNLIGDSNNNYWGHANRVLQQELGDNTEVKHLWDQFSSNMGVHTGDRTAKAGRSGASSSHISQTLTTTGGKKIKVGTLRGTQGSLFAHARSPQPFLARLIKAGLTVGKIRMKNKGGYIEMNAGGMVPTMGGAVTSQGGRTIPVPAQSGKYNMGGMVQEYQDGGAVGAFTAGLKNPYGKGIVSGMSGRPMGIGAQMGIGMGGMMAGQAVGGNAGMAIMMASNILPMMTAMKGFGSLIPSVAKVASILGRLTIPGAVIGGLTAAVMLINKFRKDAEDAGKVNRAMFGGTKEQLAEVGIQYTSISDRIKDINTQLELNKAKIESSYNSFTKSGIPGLTLTIQQLKEGIEKAKTSAKETVDLFNNADTTQVNELATSMKAQYVAMGMSVEEATNTIYTLVAASNKAKQALGAITSSGFKDITDKATAATSQVEKLGKVIEGSKAFNAEEFNVGMDAVLNGLNSYKDSLTTIKDENGKVKTETEALAETIKKIEGVTGATAKINSQNLEAYKMQNLEMAAILGKSESILSIFSKYQLVASGLSDVMDIGAMTGDAAISVAAGYQKVKDAATVVVAETAIGKLVAARVKNQGKLNDIVKAAAKQDKSYYDDAIKKNQKLIDALEEERKKRLEILELQERSQSFEVSIKQAQIKYQEALASGNMAQAAQEQLNIQKLRSDRERELARKSINDKFDAERKKLEDQIERLQNQKDAQDKAASGAAAGAARATEDTQAAKDFESQIIGIISKYGGKFNPDAQKALSVAFNNAKTSKDAGLSAAATAMEKQYITGSKTYQGSPGTGSVTVTKDKYQSMFENLSISALAKAESNDKFDTAVENFVDAVNVFKGKSGPSSPNKFGSNTPSIQAKTLKEAAKQGQLSRSQFTDPNTNSNYKLFTFQNKTYAIDSVGQVYDFDSISNKVGKKAKMAMGGYISGAGNGTSDSIPAMLSNGEYVINAKSVQAIGMPMLDRINKMAMGGPVYNVPAYSMGGKVKYNNGGMATSSNSLYNINVTLNGTDLSADDVANAIERKMKLREATIGRGRNY